MIYWQILVGTACLTLLAPFTLLGTVIDLIPCILRILHFEFHLTFPESVLHLSRV